MVCKECGYQNSRGATFCSGCGVRLHVQEDDESNEVSQQALRAQKRILAIALVVIGVVCVVLLCMIREEKKQ